MPDDGAESRQISSIIVFALAGKIGSGTTFVRDKLNQELMTYGYSTELFDVTDIVLQKNYDQYVTDNTKKDFASLDRAGRAEELQRRGNLLRKVGGNEYIARIIFNDFIYADLCECKHAKRKAYIIDSLKNPAEVGYLRNLFADTFYLIGVVADREIRKNRLKERKNYTDEQFLDISHRDEGNGEDEYGQRSVDTIVESDYFFENNFSTKDEIAKESERLLRLIFRTSIDTPRPDEEGMTLAFQASLRSACLSRQVGAAIYSKDNELIATGFNDVPQFTGGLYGSDADIPDKRCWVHGAKCYNDNEKVKIITEIVNSSSEEYKKLKSSREDIELPNGILEEIISRTVKSSRVKRLLEFSRSIHAEMEAILSVARKGISGLVGSTLYCTTYPCHNCAKHIVGAGISRLVYLEPYDKSLARTLHSDSIADAAKDVSVSNKLILDSYKGVAPKRYFQFFSSSGMDRKLNGIFVDNDRLRSNLYPVGAQLIGELSARLETAFKNDELNKIIVGNSGE